MGQPSGRRAIQRGSQEEGVSGLIVKGGGHTQGQGEWSCSVSQSAEVWDLTFSKLVEHEKVHNVMYDFEYKTTITGLKKTV